MFSWLSANASTILMFSSVDHCQMCNLQTCSYQRGDITGFRDFLEANWGQSLICQRGVTWAKRQTKQKLKVYVVLGEVVVVVACSKCYVQYVVVSGSKKRESEESSNMWHSSEDFEGTGTSAVLRINFQHIVIFIIIIIMTDMIPVGQVSCLS